MGLGSWLGKKSDKGDVTELPDQLKGTFGKDRDIIDRAESLKGLLQNGAGLGSKLPGPVGAVLKGVSGGMSLLDKGSDAVKSLTGTSGYDWLGKGAGATVEAISPTEIAKNSAPEGLQAGKGEKVIYVDGKEKVVPADQQGAGITPKEPAAEASPSQEPAQEPAQEQAAEPAGEGSTAGDAEAPARQEPLPEIR